jgi:hypothetical protein
MARPVGKPRAGSARQTAPGRGAARPLEDHNLRGGDPHHSPGRTIRAGRPINRDAFEVYVAKVLVLVLVPELRPGDVVIMDMCGRPLGRKKNFRVGAARRRVLTCVRPLVRPGRPRAHMGVCGSVHFNLARFERSSNLPIPSLDRCAIPLQLTFRPPNGLAARISD